MPSGSILEGCYNNILVLSTVTVEVTAHERLLRKLSSHETTSLLSFAAMNYGQQYITLRFALLSIASNKSWYI